MFALVALSAMSVAAEPAEIIERVDAAAIYRSMRITPDITPIPPDEYARAAGGKVVTGLVSVEGHKNKKAYGLAVIDVPIAQFWAAINDDASKVKYTKVTYAEQLVGEPCDSRRQIFQFLSVPFMSNRWWISNLAVNLPIALASAGRVRELSWQTADPHSLKSESAREWANKGIPVNYTKGGWLLIELDSTQTFVEYTTWSHPGGSVPLSLVNSFAAKGIKETFATMTRLANDGPTCPLN